MKQKLSLLFRQISLGDHNLVTDPDCGEETCDCNEVECAAPSVRRKITSEDQIIIHENYNPNAQNNIENDIALVRLNEPVPLFTEDPTKSIAMPICLPWSENDPGKVIFRSQEF